MTLTRKRVICASYCDGGIDARLIASPMEISCSFRDRRLVRSGRNSINLAPGGKDGLEIVSVERGQGTDRDRNHFLRVIPVACDRRCDGVSDRLDDEGSPRVGLVLERNHG